MLLVVVLGMAANWMLAEALSTYLLQEASEHHLSAKHNKAGSVSAMATEFLWCSAVRFGRMFGIFEDP